MKKRNYKTFYKIILH